MTQIQRRRFLLASGALLAAPLARAQPAGKVYRVGYLSFNPPQKASHLLAALKEGLRCSLTTCRELVGCKSRRGEISRSPL